MTFLVDKESIYTYEHLLDSIIATDVYYDNYKPSSLFDYFANLIKALVNNIDITLIDFDATLTNIADIDECHINTRYTINIVHINSLADLLKRVYSSNSKLTIYTSGTTGQPKKITHRITSLIRDIKISEKHSNDIWAYAYNPTHMAGLQVFFQAFLNMNQIVNVFGFDRSFICDKLNTYKITHISATPTFYRLLLPFESPFNNVKKVTLGGEKSNMQLYNLLYKLFPNSKITNVYASTEAGTLLASKGELFQIPFAKRDLFKICDGELIIHHSLIGESNTLNLIDGYYYSGDIIEWVNKDELLFKFISRKNELINIGGYKVNPNEVENIISEIKGVVQVLVYSKTNSILGNILCADIKVEDSLSLSEIDIRKYLSLKIQDFKIPRRIRFVSNLQLTKTGKIKRK